MLKLLGGVLLAGGAAAMGYSASAWLARRVRTLRAMLGALELMEREISFRLTPMDRLLDRLARGTPPPAGTFFACCRDGLERLGERTLAEIWREALEQTPLGLGAGELATLAELGELLGRYDAEGQREALSNARLRLEQDLRLAEEEREKKGRVCRALGLTAGAFLVIVLL